jgi:hypothetical protein
MIMKKFVQLCAAFFAMALLFSASPVMAQLWVGPNGSDANACTQTSPCATFQHAVNNGAFQINCLASGDYGAVIITASLTIDCGAGNVGNIITSATSGITINTTGQATIILRHLAVNGLGAGATKDGIHAAAFFSGTLIVEDCIIFAYPQGNGINFGPNNGRGLLQVSNSQFFANSSGITVVPAASQIASVTLDQVQLTGNSNYGLQLGGAGVVAGAMNNSIAGSNTLDGVFANAGQVFFTVNQSIIVANLANGVHTGTAGSNLNVSASTMAGNGTGVLASAGALVSFGNNALNSNGVDGHFTSTIALK